MILARRAGLYAANTDSREADAMRKLTFGMNLSLDGYIAAPGDDLGWSVPSPGTPTGRRSSPRPAAPFSVTQRGNVYSL